MSQSLSSRLTPNVATPIVEKKAARKRYAAPQLEVYGTVQELTHTSFTGTGFDSGVYSYSGIG